MLYDGVRSLGDVRINKFYQPFQWMHHTTIAKKLTGEEMQAGFRALQAEFTCREGKVVKIGLATKQPYREIREWRL